MSSLRPIAQPKPLAARPALPAARTAVAAPTVASRPVRAVAAQHPSVGATWSQLIAGLVTGRTVVLPGVSPAYPKLDAAEAQAAALRGAGRTVTQPFLNGNTAGTELAEPVNFVLTGSRADLEKALTSQGWVKANDRSVWSFVKVGLSALFHLGHETAGPVSQQFLNGKGEDMAFNKNSDFNLARDHMRVYHQGKDPLTGQDVWAIAATRDVALEVAMPRRTGWHLSAPGIGHQVDKRIDAERDMIMRDMLASGLVKTWAAVDGQRPDGLAGTLKPNGKLNVAGYETDGRVYELTLGQ